MSASTEFGHSLLWWHPTTMFFAHTFLESTGWSCGHSDMRPNRQQRRMPWLVCALTRVDAHFLLPSLHAEMARHSPCSKHMQSACGR